MSNGLEINFTWTVVMDSSPPPLTSDPSPDFSAFQSSDGSIRATCWGHFKEYLLRVPVGCEVLMHMPATKVAQCAIKKKEDFSLVSMASNMEVCDPCSEFLLKHQQEAAAQACSGGSQLTQAESEDTDSETITSEQDDKGPVPKKPRLSLPPESPTPTPSAPDVPCVYTIIMADAPTDSVDASAGSAGMIPSAATKPGRKRKIFSGRKNQGFENVLQTAMEQKTIPQWQQTEEKQTREDALKNSFLFYCVAREKARYKKLRQLPPQALSDPRFDCPVINGGQGQPAQRFCNIHREDDYESIGILDQMQTHPSVTAYKSNGNMTDDEFRHFILTLVIGRLFNSGDTLRNLGHVSLANLETVYGLCEADKSKLSRHAAYMLNNAYGKVGMDMKRFIFELVPLAVKQMPPLSELRLVQEPLPIETLSEKLNECLQKALPIWYAQQKNQIAIHEFKTPRSTANKPVSETRRSGTHEFKMEGEKVFSRPAGSQGEFKYAHAQSTTLNYKFNFSQAFADAAALCPNLVSLDSGMVPGTGTKSALDHFNPDRRGNANDQAGLQQLYLGLKDQWPAELGVFNKVTLEHSLCEWNRWLEVRLGHREGRKAYKPRGGTSESKNEPMES